MDASSPDYKQLWEAAKRAQQDAERAQRDAEQARRDAELALKQAQEKTRKTTLPEFLNAVDAASPDYKQLWETAKLERDQAQEKTRKTTLPEFLDAVDAASPDYKQLWEASEKKTRKTTLPEFLNAVDAASPDYKQLWEAAKLAQQDAERAQRDAELERDQAKEKTRKTTLPELLDACHTHLYSGLTVQTNMTLSTQGDPSNANEKVRPDRICLWKDFPARQQAIWDTIVESDFIEERHFTSVNTLLENGETITRRMMSSELDLHTFQRSTVEDHVSSVIEHLHDNKKLKKAFGLKGSVQFENHSNTLTPDVNIEEGMRHMNISGRKLRRSPRLLTRGESSNSRPSTTAPELTAKIAHPRADQFCVYNIPGNALSTGSRTAALVMEYKPPHKLTLGHMYAALEEEDICLEEVVCYKDTDEAKEHSRRLVAATITQAFSYMVSAGVEFGCVCNGEATIFLRVPEDPRTVYYFLSVPKGDVGHSTGWDPDGHQNNRLHLTAVGQMLAFTLQGLQTSPRKHSWRASALKKLHTWSIVYDDLVEAIPEENAPSSEYRPLLEDSYLRASPIRLRSRPHGGRSSPCKPQDPVGPDDSNEDDFDPETPSRQAPPVPSRTAKQGTKSAGSSSTNRTASGFTAGQQYCTQECLRGLLRGGALDESCPNVHEHGHKRHRIKAAQFCALMRQQLAADMDENFEAIGIPGSRGVPFRVRLASHGYTLAAKCTTADFIPHLMHEATVYDRLRPIQGIHVPVHLGNIDLAEGYYYEGIVVLTHVMFLSFGGLPVHRQFSAVDRTQLIDQAVSCFQAIHNLGVLHRDAESRNILRDAKTGKVLVVDFERAQLRVSRPVLGTLSSNRKRPRDDAALLKKGSNSDLAYSRERNAVMHELSHIRLL